MQPSNDKREEELKLRIRELFTRVKVEHREQVVNRLRELRDNETRCNYLRGWTKSA
jgi:hypothetical protein